MKRQFGQYSIEFVLTFLVLFSMLMVAIEVSRYFLVRSMLDLSFRQMVYDSRTNVERPLSADVINHFSNQNWFERSDVTVTSLACESLQAYQRQRCIAGKGSAQQIVRYTLNYTFQPLIPLYEGDWQYRSVILMRNEPDFTSSRW